jgi:glycosyltransferase involved in cell wall biosynthesis
MRILYITNYQGPAVVAQRGQLRNRTLGPSRKVELFARGLLAKGHVVDIVSAGTVSEGTFLHYSGFKVQEPTCGGAWVSYLPGIDIPRINLLYASRMLARFLARVDDYDAVFLYNLEWYFLSPVLEHSSKVKCPVVVEYEDDAMTRIGARLACWHQARGSRAISAAKRRVAGVVAVSPELGRQLGHENTVVIPGLVGSELLSINREVSNVPPAGPLRLIYTGGLTRPKGPGLLIEAANCISFPVELDIVGGGNELSALQEQALKSKWPVRVHGELPREQMVDLLRRSHIAVNPHRFEAGQLGQIFPFKIVEYVGSGIPVVSSRFGEFPLPTRDSFVIYADDSPQSLADAIGRARYVWPSLVEGARAARAWVEAEYSESAAAGKLENVLVRATGVSETRPTSRASSAEVLMERDV